STCVTADDRLSDGAGAAATTIPTLLVRPLFALSASASVRTTVADAAEPDPDHAQVRAAPLIVSPLGRPVAVIVEPAVAPEMLPAAGVPIVSVVADSPSAERLACSKTFDTPTVKTVSRG